MFLSKQASLLPRSRSKEGKQLPDPQQLRDTPPFSLSLLAKQARAWTSWRS